MTIRVSDRWIRPPLHIREAGPGVRVEAGPVSPGHLLLRLFILFAVVFPGGSTALAVYAMDGAPVGAALAGALVELLFAPFWLFFVWIGGLVTEYWERVELDPEAGALRARTRGRWVFFSRSVEVPFERFRRVDVAVEAGDDSGGGPRMELEVEHEEAAASSGEDGGRRRRMAGRLEADREAEKLSALVQRMAAVLGWEGIEVVRRDHLGTRVRLTPRGPSRPTAADTWREDTPEAGAFGADGDDPPD